MKKIKENTDKFKFTGVPWNILFTPSLKTNGCILIRIPTDTHAKDFQTTPERRSNKRANSEFTPTRRTLWAWCGCNSHLGFHVPHLDSLLAQFPKFMGIKLKASVPVFLTFWVNMLSGSKNYHARHYTIFFYYFSLDLPKPFNMRSDRNTFNSYAIKKVLARHCWR